MTKNPPDNFARALAVFGAAVSLISLGLNFYNLYRDLDEKVVARLSGSLTATLGLDEKGALVSDLDPKGKLAVEVTNIGLHPVYLKGITASFNCPPNQSCPARLTFFTFFRIEAIEGSEPPRRLEPGEAANYVLVVDSSNLVDFSDDELLQQRLARGVKGLKKMSVTVTVDTTKKSFSQEVQYAHFNFSTVFLGNSKKSAASNSVKRPG